MNKENKANPEIYVTRPYLPPIDELIPLLREIWDSRVLTNSGPFHEELEAELASFLNVPYISLFSNGTLALITALQSLRVTGEVITTPYSFVATAHSLLWQGVKPVFVDIDKHTLNINPKLIEAAITPRTTAILPVHCYGNICDVDSIKAIADTYNLRVIYDACHAFGVKTSRGSILTAGDLSVLSFHATKVFNTFEGGAIVSPSLSMKNRIDHLKNFGFDGELSVIGPGINGKMSEFNAALGLVQLKHFNEIIEKRKKIDEHYRCEIASITGLKCLEKQEDVYTNYSYFAIKVMKDYPLSRDALYDKLKSNGIYTRRYFYPLISDFPMYANLPSAEPGNLPISRETSGSILCLPIYPDLSEQDQEKIISLLRNYPDTHDKSNEALPNKCKSSS